MKVLRRLANGAMEPILMTNISFKPAPDSQLNPLLLPIQLPYLMVDRIINRVESVLQLNESDRVGSSSCATCASPLVRFKDVCKGIRNAPPLEAHA